ncbi:zinc ribbon domain-containing protein [Streptomyces sp. ID05-47C]|uniref:zinc ribbon domain-containing protein n=1 Tax=Streptomyces sp. ID05-47C TaxID=3028665 RepID=UPI0029A3771C|nr:zinc ribbon domain-containing protein [Streptomyces sp. ID05-47C]MDX3569046.1 zinc ribbon domain-containing protein [Streptomyces sp. ID05-47C]
MTTAATHDETAEAEREPLDALVDVLCQVETSLDRGVVRAVTADVVRQRARQRRLATELAEAPDVLRTGKSPAAIMVGKLLLALKRAGAEQLAAPVCGGCGREPRTLTFARRTWGCSRCVSSPSLAACTECEQERDVHARDRDGRPFCRACFVDDDVTTLLAEVVIGIAPEVTAEAVHGALERAHQRPVGRRQIAAHVLERPELLTGEGASAPIPGILRFIKELRAAGATSVIVPLCPSCGRANPLGPPLGAVRVCGNCAAKVRASICSRCGKQKPINHRDENGDPFCQPCWASDPRNLEVCAGCGNRRRVYGRTAAGPVCLQCRPRPERVCAICGRTGRGTISRATGRPLCDLCKGHWIVCSACGDGGLVRGGTLKEPLCARCVNPDPDFWKRCRICNTTWQLMTAPCTRCSLDARLRKVFAADDGTIAPELHRLRERLVQVDRPIYAITWLQKKNVQSTITALVHEHFQISHAALDAMPPSKTLDHFRSMLVSVGALEFRDEGLVRLEREVKETLDGYAPGEHPRALRGFIPWHLMRRLRGRLKDKPASAQQILNVRTHLVGADGLLRWLEGRGKSLSGCTQADIESYLSTKPAHPKKCSAFVRWAVRRKYAPAGIKAPAIRWTGPAGPHDQDERWAVARRLLNDESVATADRVAGLLVLLYAQTASSIHRLTTDRVTPADDHVLLHLGDQPIQLPAPLDRFMLDLVASRGTDTLIRHEGDWLFPGRSVGRPIHESQLLRRLRRAGVKSRQGRSTALFALAQELPAGQLAKMLGVHVGVAVTWQRASGGDWMTYAAAVAARSATRARPEVDNTTET